MAEMYVWGTFSIGPGSSEREVGTRPSLGSTITGGGTGPLDFSKLNRRLGRSLCSGLWPVWGPGKCPSHLSYCRASRQQL